jgi:hypothetical protein
VVETISSIQLFDLSGNPTTGEILH